VPPRTPRCPDCSSPNTHRLDDAGDDRAWICPDCAHRFGHRDKPYKALPVRTRDEWLELITTMLPAPVRTNERGELLGGDPVAVIVHVGDDAIHIQVAGIAWRDSHTPVLKGRPFANAPRRATAARVAELIGLAWGQRLSAYRWCPRCRRRMPPEHMLTGLCHGCASAVLGIVF
jgi:hypothetical protein